MAGTLYVVGTPIGNLKDITYRAVETLSSVDVIACEDTRVSLKLLSYYNVKKPLISYYKQKEREGSGKIISLLKEGKNVALITDAGMPCVSDPGAILVSECRKAGLKVEIVPGGKRGRVGSRAFGDNFARVHFFWDFFARKKRKDKEELVKDF
ncbi:MAG: SAM-dependent methyltransferase [Clostridiales bacterium]|nr:MAG: SAM-dependent methyltransferase [Clostridiales bacterium]